MSMRVAQMLIRSSRCLPTLSRPSSRSLAGGPAVPPFKRNLAPTQTLHEEHELGMSL